MTLKERLGKIKLILSDVDGVLTDGGIIYTNEGIEIKRFHVRDGMGIRLWQKAGYRFGIITSRTSNVVKTRSDELQIDVLRQGVHDKVTTVHEILQQMQLTPEETCFIGDDLVDLAVIRYVGLGVAVADAVEEVRGEANLVTRLPGGQGAVRETVETILKGQQNWDKLIGKW